MKVKYNEDCYDVRKNLLRMSLPTMLGYLFQTLYDLVDMIWIGKLSYKSLAAVTIFSTVFWAVIILNEIIGSSSVSIISQSYGSGDMDRTRIAIEQTFTFKALVAIIAVIILLPSLKPLLRFFTKDKEVLQEALDFGYIRIFFLPAMFSSFSVNTAFRCIGEVKKPMIIMIIASITNVILDPIFMFEKVPFFNIRGFNMGIFGAALATVISTTLAFLIGFYFFISGKEKVKISFKGLFKLYWPLDKKLIILGMPSGFEMLTKNLAGIFTLKLISVYGTEAVAATGIGNKLLNFAYMPLVGLAMGGSALVGQFLGEREIKKAKDTAKEAAKIGAMILSIFSVFAFIFAENIMKVFTNEPSVIKIGIPMIRFILPGLIAMAIGKGFAIVFSGSGYNLPYFISSLVSGWIFQVPVLFLITKVFKLNIKFVWINFVIVSFSEMLMLLLFYRKGKWRHFTI